MRFRRIQWYARIGMVLAIPLLVLGAGINAPAKAETPEIASDCGSKITWEVCKEAAVTKFKCYIDLYQKKYPSVHFTIGLKNVSDSPQRFRVNIFLPDGKAVGGLITPKGKPPVIEPGKEGEFTYPVKNYDKIPPEIEVLVKTASY